MPQHLDTRINLNGTRNKRGVLEVRPRLPELDDAVKAALTEVSSRYLRKKREAEKLIADLGLTIEVERFRDALDRVALSDAERALLAQPGIAHHLLLGALQADRLERDDEEREREERERRYEAEEHTQTHLLAAISQGLGAMATLARENQEITKQNQAILRKLLDEQRIDDEPADTRTPDRGAPAADVAPGEATDSPPATGTQRAADRPGKRTSGQKKS